MSFDLFSRWRIVTRVPEYLLGHGDVGKSRKLADSAFWLDERGITWALAVEAIDKRGDKAPLITLLWSDGTMPPEARGFIADLLERYELKKKTRGRPRLPIYDRSLVEAILLIGIQRIKEYRERGISVSEAVELAAEEFRLDPNKLRDAYHGKRGASRPHRPKKLTKGRTSTSAPPSRSDLA
jgi:hypothetical protein